MKTATHKAKGKHKDFYYRKAQVRFAITKYLLPLIAEWEFYDSYQGKWIKSFAPHSEIVRL